jgi:hypothetical protein
MRFNIDVGIFPLPHRKVGKGVEEIPLDILIVGKI